ncbi:hypothetical protein [Actinacidiphila glaucinigra]|uniref:Uncharacterized protein n=1 Tax=Actinacidiphila glaucinigra TaxID=235986 RepID=A0A239DQ51_9ACTN|nr:hypothetical protein [Actinacidiphila glaucinigra]SNS34457.1 hypothetical protein SAMN05216252_105101 [Actinacidiphila glaucinigra]
MAVALATIVTSTLTGSMSAVADGSSIRSDHWGVIARNTIGSPVADLRDGPYGSYGVTGSAARPPYGRGSLGLAVSDDSTSLTPPSEKVDFGNEVDFYNDRVRDLTKLGFHVFQTAENVSYGGTRNLPGIRIEINPNLASRPGDTYSTLVWVPPAVAPTNQWSGYLDATVSNGEWFLSGGELAPLCTQASPCNFTTLKNSIDSDGGSPATIYTIAVGKGRDHIWVGAVDGLRINRYVYDFEANAVTARRVG